MKIIHRIFIYFLIILFLFLIISIILFDNKYIFIVFFIWFQLIINIFPYLILININKRTMNIYTYIKN